MNLDDQVMIVPQVVPEARLLAVHLGAKMTLGRFLLSVHVEMAVDVRAAGRRVRTEPAEVHELALSRVAMQSVSTPDSPVFFVCLNRRTWRGETGEKKKIL